MLNAARDRALLGVLAYTAVRVSELLRDPDGSRRRSVRWEVINLEDGSMDVYQKKQQWGAAIPGSRYVTITELPETDELADRAVARVPDALLADTYKTRAGEAR